MKERSIGPCVHKIVSFQAHRGCLELAAICEKGCQEAHQTDQDRELISVEAVEDHFVSIKETLFQEMKCFVDPLAELYNKLNAELHEQQTRHLKEVELELRS